MRHLRLDERLQLKGRIMASKIVDVFDNSGAKLFSYSIALEDAGCLDAEFEEAALIFAESSGAVPREEFAQLRACCDIAPAEDAPAPISQEPQRKRRKGKVVSLVKHRMKRAHAVAIREGRWRAS